MTWIYSDQWAAGFFDGEGCITVDMRRDGKPGSVVACVTQKLRAPLDELQARWGGAVDRKRTRSGCYRWRCSAQQARAFLRAIYPFTLVKRPQIQIAFAYLDTMSPTGAVTPADVLQQRLALRQELSDAKRDWGV